ncbi:hypothetical protein G7Y79_00008g023780 [Physcia stellaris]|nr:hypothetical protein G7Y79_00008g023780 [Physcia stellaris]
MGGGRENAEKEGRTEANREGKEVGEAEGHRETENWRGTLPRACVGPDASDLADFEAGEAAAWKTALAKAARGQRLILAWLQAKWTRLPSEHAEQVVHGGQATLAFSEDLHTDLGVAIGRREGFGATIGLEAISAQDIGFFGVATDGVGDTLSERSRTISGVGIERGKSFGDEGGEEVTDRGDEAGGEEVIDSEAGETTDC